MNTPQLIPVTPGNLNGQSAQLVDARILHDFLASQQDFSTWIKRRICKYGFELGCDYLLHKMVEQVPHMGGVRQTTVDQYNLTLDMAKELAMVERTSRGREARRYFIECERQLHRLQPTYRPTVHAYPVPLSKPERQAINRQAWAEVAGETQAIFHARRELLLRERLRNPRDGIVYLPQGFVPEWAR